MNAIVSPERTARRVEGARRRSATPSGRRALHGVIGVLLVAGAVYTQTFQMTSEDSVMPLTWKGTIGQAVTTTRFSAKVESITAAHAVRFDDPGGRPVDVQTDALFLIVKVSATVPKEPMQLAKLTPPVLLSGDGRRYNPTDKVDEGATLFQKWIQPGWWATGVLVYEVPRDALPGADFVFLPPTGLIVVDSMLPEAQIDLGLDQAAADRLAGQAADTVTLTGAGG
ncbi:hypothetical protein J5X84_14610 [Streptosporangiaceae bacterium NEAU-GS5]|nr:hypothetical protein [Streptosporangiaceae bacterium NEAU-GS5]